MVAGQHLHPVASGRGAPPGPPLLEREAQLGSLRRALAGRGHVVLVRGEAGAGKSALVRHFLGECGGRTGTWVGLCDPLRRPPAPLRRDTSSPAGGEVADLLAAPHGDPAWPTALLDAVSRGPERTVLVFEDLHWGDDDALDLAVFLGRRIAGLPLVLVLTYRDDELGPLHPLHHALAQLPSEHVTTVTLPPLSLGAVTELARPSGLEAGPVFELSGGNPLCAAELLAAGTLEVPPRIRALTFARLAGLSEDGRAVARLAAAHPDGVEPWRLDEAAGTPGNALEDCLSSGLLVLRDGRLAFRQELSRRVVREACGPVHRAGPAADVACSAMRYTVSRDRARAGAAIARALDSAADPGTRRRLRAVRSLLHLHHGAWADAEADAVAVAGTGDPAGALAGSVLRRIRARRGLPPEGPVGPGRGGEPAAEAAVAAAEQSWWRDFAVPDPAPLRRALETAWDHRHPWRAGELAWWLHRAGAAPPVADWYAEPYLLMLRGNWRQAAAAWAALGCPFEEAEALGAAGDGRALRLFDELGATAAAARLRLANPSRAGTSGPCVLTGRQREVLGHLADGASNADIAAALGISVRTVDHHVAAVLMRLSVGSRREAVAAAARLGIGLGNSPVDGPGSWAVTTDSRRRGRWQGEPRSGSQS